MEYRQLGTSELSVSKIGFGCMSLHPEHANDNEILLKEAFDSGINFFDTADLYDKGSNEIILGKALSPYRHKVLIATKVGNQWNEDGTTWRWNTSKYYILKAAEESLQRLGTDYIDLYQLHGGTTDDNIAEIIETFELLKKQGKIREYGISSIRPNVIRKWVAGSKLVSVMMQYSFLDRRPEESCFNVLKTNGISVLARGSLAQGILAGKTTKAVQGYTEEQVRLLTDSINKVGNPVSVALQFVLRATPVASAVVGLRTAEQLKSVLLAAQEKIAAEQLNALAQILHPDFYRQHR